MARPRKPLIDSEHAVRTALQMIDEEGLAAFSVEKLSARLGVRGPSLYHHFADRADLLARVAQLVLREVPDPWDPSASRDPDETWDAQVLRMTLDFRRALLRHPNAGPVVLAHFPRQLVLEVYERVVTALEEAEVPDRYHLLIFEGLEKLTLGSALYWSAARSQPGGRRGGAFPELDAERFPALSRATRASEYDDEALFETSCIAFLDGVKALVAADAGAV